MNKLLKILSVIALSLFSIVNVNAAEKMGYANGLFSNKLS
jgi:hypothetical protein